MEFTEIVQKGDMYWKASKQEFVPCVASIGHPVNRNFKSVATVITGRPVEAPVAARPPVDVPPANLAANPANKDVDVRDGWLERMVGNGEIASRNHEGTEWHRKSIYLAETEYNWTLKRDNSGHLCLIPRRK